MAPQTSSSSEHIRTRLAGDARSARQSNHYWPIERLKRITRYLHDNQTWLGGPRIVLTNSKSPEPFVPNTKMSCLMRPDNPSEFSHWQRPARAEVLFYDVFGLYSEVRDLELEEGVVELLQHS